MNKHVLAPYAQAVISGGGGSISDLLPSDVSQYISLPYTTTLASVTITPPTGGTAPYSVTSTLCQDEAGTVITTASPSTFVRTFSVAQAKGYLLTVGISDSAGQITYSSYLVAVAKAPSLGWVPPASLSLSSGTTSSTLTWNSPSGGVGPYTYGPSTMSFDSSGAYALGLSDAGLVTSITSITSGTFILERTVTDATGASVTIQAAMIVNAVSSSIISGTAPSNLVLPAGTTSVIIGSWLPASGGTPAYSYVLTEPTGNGSVITGTPLGPYSASGLTNGRTYAYQLEITDSLGAKGFSICTISVAYEVPEWIVVQETDFTDANWTALNSTDVTTSITVPQHILYAADGTTPRAQVWNNTAQVRRLRIDPSSTGLALICTNPAATPSIKIVILNASGQNVLQSINFVEDLVKIEFLVEGEEPVGTGALIHLSAFSNVNTNTATQHGQRVTNSGSNVLIQRRAWVGADNLLTDATVAVGTSRKYCSQYELYITGSRTVESYARHAASITDLTPVPRSAKYMMHDSVSQVLSLTPSLVAFNTTTSYNGYGFILYIDGSFADTGVANQLSRVTLKKVRISRLPSGSKA